MKTQVLYASFMSRMFSTMMDLSLVAILLIPVTKLVFRRVFINKFGDLLKAKNIDLDNDQSITNFLSSPEFLPYSNNDTMIELVIPILLVQIFCVILYFVLCWHYLGATPVKYILRIKVVDKVTFKKPTIFQSVRRILGALFFPLGIWSVFFTKEQQMFHDKIAGTVVIKA